MSDKLDRPYQYMEEIPMLAMSPSGRNKLYKLFKFDIKHKFFFSNQSCYIVTKLLIHMYIHTTEI